MSAAQTRADLTLPLSILSGSIHPANQHVCTGQAVTAPNHRGRCQHGEKDQDYAWRHEEKGQGIRLCHQGLWNSFLVLLRQHHCLKQQKLRPSLPRCLCISDQIHTLFPFQAFQSILLVSHPPFCRNDDAVPTAAHSDRGQQLANLRLLLAQNVSLGEMIARGDKLFFSPCALIIAGLQCTASVPELWNYGCLELSSSATSIFSSWHLSTYSYYCVPVIHEDAQSS